ncbi:MAG TPA: cytochrome c [Vicinamibacterales bacterium]|nr:cytochrome c [Vicinamibacterales bacterium]
MRRFLLWLIGLIVIGLVAAAAGLAYVRVTGLTARAKPSEAETGLARAVRSFAISGRDRARTNPVPRSEAAMQAGLEHFADHCAVCHGNDGGGVTNFGRGMFPPSPDLRAEATQRMTDGELFYIIENGVRFTGMPAFATGTAEGEEESWKLVHFIRRLPRLSAPELERMKELNPRSPEEIRHEIAEEEFLRGEP